MDPKPTNPLVNLPGAIIIAAAIVAIAIIWARQPVKKAPVVSAPVETANIISLSPIRSDEHILGNPAAPIRLVEFSDASCPYCKNFNPTLDHVMAKYGATGELAWVYRHYPIQDSSGALLHQNAQRQAEALECVASLGGNAKFWEFEKAWYTAIPLDGATRTSDVDQKEIFRIAKDAGIDTVALNDCISSGRFKPDVQKDYLDGINAGVNGTPTSFLVLSKPAGAYVEKFISASILQYRLQKDLLFLSNDKKIISMSGSMPENLVKGLIESILTEQKAAASANNN